LQSSLINSQGKVSWWLYYQIAQQVSTAVVILVAYPYGIDVVAYAYAAKTFLLWPATVYMSIRLLETGIGRYLRSFVAPAVASLAMLAAVFAIRSATADLNNIESLALQVCGGGVIYISTLFAFAYRRVRQAFALISKRRTVSP
jgi:teichuronic acid exporter